MSVGRRRPFRVPLQIKAWLCTSHACRRRRHRRHRQIHQPRDLEGYSPH